MLSEWVFLPSDMHTAHGRLAMQVIKSIFSPADQEFMNGSHSGRGSGAGPVPLRIGNSITAIWVKLLGLFS